MVAIFIGLSFSGVIYAYFMSIVITCVAFAVYFIKKISFSVKESDLDSMWKELLSFSIPLFIVAILGMIMGYTYTLMLGYFKTPDVVGLYNGVLPLAQLITVILGSSGFIYTPIVPGLYSKGLIEEMGRTYQILTKWIFSVTFPVFLVIFLFPETVLNFLWIKLRSGSPGIENLSSWL
ncbi:oligosaccharide flippase family protein [Thermococcus sp. 101 C5]|nr:oligosaccharide flippase family protein [Thermococcus sp. 101 C5]